MHIPGADNHFCDLLSRNGCAQTAAEWQPTSIKVHDIKPQMAVITPQEQDTVAGVGPHDLDIRGDDIMPAVTKDEWPNATAIHNAQEQHNITSDHVNAEGDAPLHTDVTGKIILSAASNITATIIAICHQGDLTHRSMDDNTIIEFEKTYVLHNMTRTQQTNYIKDKCRRCLSCIKTRTGRTIPRPLWYMVYATRPFEYLHLDFMEMPDAANGCKHVLVITDDFSLTTLIHATTNATADTVADVLLNHWLSHYPDPDLLHTDGGTHFDNEVIKKITDAREWGHSICTPHAKWAHGVAERNNKTVIQVFTPLCRKLDIEINKWPCLTKIVQGAMNRMRRKSRGNLSPIQLTTGQKPRTAAETLHKGQDIIDVLDEEATLTLQESVREMA